MPKRTKLMLGIFCVLFTSMGLLFFAVGLYSFIQIGDEIILAVMFLGLIAMIIGLMPIMIIFRKRHIKKIVLREGIRIETDFVDVIMAEYSINDWQPYIVRSQWLDDKTQKLYRFKSPGITSDPRDFLNEDLKIPVYILENNPKRYFMDLNAAEGLSGIRLV
ncbi:hypothetical protein [Ignatzschineria sp. LJL83]